MARVFDAPLIVNDQSIDRLLASQLPVLMLFWDGDSLPQALNDAMLEMAAEHAGDLLIAKVHTRENPAAAQQFNIVQTPTVVGVTGGEELTRAARPAPEDLTRHAEYLLGRGEKPQAQRAPSSTNGSVGSQSRPVVVTDATFETEVLRAPIPVLVDFWAPWCGPCHMIAPTLEKLARDFAGQIKIAKLNVDENPHHAGVYGVQSIPTLLLVQNGKVVDRLVGAMPEQYLRARIEQLVKA